MFYKSAVHGSILTIQLAGTQQGLLAVLFEECSKCSSAARRVVKVHRSWRHADHTAGRYAAKKASLSLMK
jgi:hypothetical protein